MTTSAEEQVVKAKQAIIEFEAREDWAGAGRALGVLPEMVFDEPDPVVQVIDESNKEVLYTVRIKGKTFLPKVYSDGKYTG